MTNHPAVRLVTAFVPLAFTPVLASAINAGTLNFGGGEKDIILVVPWVLWTGAYALAALVCWRRRLNLARSLGWAVAWASGATITIALLLALLAPHFLGVG